MADMRYSGCAHSDRVQMEKYYTEKFTRRATKEGTHSRDKPSKSNNRSCGFRLKSARKRFQQRSDTYDLKLYIAPESWTES